MKLDFENEPPENALYEQHFSKKDEHSIENEIKKLLSKGIVEKCEKYITNSQNEMIPAD